MCLFTNCHMHRGTTGPPSTEAAIEKQFPRRQMEWNRVREKKLGWRFRPPPLPPSPWGARGARDRFQRESKTGRKRGARGMNEQGKESRGWNSGRGWKGGGWGRERGAREEIAEEKPYLQQVQSVVRWKGHSSLRLLPQSPFLFLPLLKPQALWRRRASPLAKNEPWPAADNAT